MTCGTHREHTTSTRFDRLVLPMQHEYSLALDDQEIRLAEDNCCAVSGSEKSETDSSTITGTCVYNETPDTLFFVSQCLSGTSTHSPGTLPTLRFEEPAVNSPVREGGVDATVSYLSAEGASRFVQALRASGLWRGCSPRPDGRGY